MDKTSDGAFLATAGFEDSEISGMSNRSGAFIKGLMDEKVANCAALTKVRATCGRQFWGLIVLGALFVITFGFAISNGSKVGELTIKSENLDRQATSLAQKLDETKGELIAANAQAERTLPLQADVKRLEGELADAKRVGNKAIDDLDDALKGKGLAEEAKKTAEGDAATAKKKVEELEGKAKEVEKEVAAKVKSVETAGNAKLEELTRRLAALEIRPAPQQQASTMSASVGGAVDPVSQSAIRTGGGYRETGFCRSCGKPAATHITVYRNGGTERLCPKDVILADGRVINVANMRKVYDAQGRVIDVRAPAPSPEVRVLEVR